MLLLDPFIFYLAAMLRLLTISVAWAIIFSQTLAGEAIFNDSYYWPLKLTKKLSSGFGDTRPGRFHMGIDLRTNSQVGAKIYAPEDGYVYRMKTSYSGYGKALYIKGLSGRIFVFGHLLRYNWDIGTYLRERQIESRRYYQDFTVPEGDLPVKRGQFIARTGQSGAGAPHLHFEIRNADNQPTNPLYYRVDLGDKTPPEFQAVWLAAFDDSTLFEGGRREIKLVPSAGKNKGDYFITDTVAVSGRFGIRAAIGDFVGRGSFVLGPAQVRLLIDGKTYHEVEYDRIDYGENIYSLLDRDFDPEKEDYKRVFNLFQKDGNSFSNYRNEVDGNGLFEDTGGGYHDILIEASDPFGNESRLAFTVYCHTVNNILAPLNKSDFTDSLVTLIYNDQNSRRNFDSAALFMTGDGGRSATHVPLTPDIEAGEYSLTIRGTLNHTTEYRLQLYKEGLPYPSYYFSTAGVDMIGDGAIDSIDIKIIDDGILITARASQPGINWLQAEIISNIGSERRFFRKSGNREFALYYRPGREVTEIGSLITRGPVGFLPDTLSLSIFGLRTENRNLAEIFPGCRLSLDEGQLFSDALIDVRDTVIPHPETGRYIYGPLAIMPVNCSFADWTDLQTDIPDDIVDPGKTGLYVWHDKKGWLWAGGEFEPANRRLHSKLGGGGIVAVITDTVAPVVTGLNIEEGMRLNSSRPEITFKLIDELSKIEDDRNFTVSIDGRWIVPEYDPEREDFIGKPHWELSRGNHKLEIVVTDRCDNQTSVTRNFKIR